MTRPSFGDVERRLRETYAATSVATDRDAADQFVPEHASLQVQPIGWSAPPARRRAHWVAPSAAAATVLVAAGAIAATHELRPGSPDAPGGPGSVTSTRAVPAPTSRIPVARGTETPPLTRPRVTAKVSYSTPPPDKREPAWSQRCISTTIDPPAYDVIGMTLTQARAYVAPAHGAVLVYGADGHYLPKTPVGDRYTIMVTMSGNKILFAVWTH